MKDREILRNVLYELLDGDTDKLLRAMQAVNKHCRACDEIQIAIGADETGGYGRGVQPVRNKFRAHLRKMLRLIERKER